jgi:23S rRNA (cytidine1920-2'-O)/16S rRNA (cytidine1409-2'-O)-methyltransferase
MSHAERMRLDEALVRAGLAQSRSRARDMVLRGTVAVDGERADKPARKVGRDERLSVSDPASAYVSRAALKLAAGLDAFSFSPAGLCALDLGAATGGFSQVLLERGAEWVVAVDVGHGQMDPSLAADPRMSVHEGLNARDLTRAHLGGGRIGAIVSDVSFISLRLALPARSGARRAGAWGVFLVNRNSRSAATRSVKAASCGIRRWREDAPTSWPPGWGWSRAGAWPASFPRRFPAGTAVRNTCSGPGKAAAPMTEIVTVEAIGHRGDGIFRTPEGTGYVPFALPGRACGGRAERASAGGWWRCWSPALSVPFRPAATSADAAAARCR